jgi:hypothetical protein
MEYLLLFAVKMVGTKAVAEKMQKLINPNAKRTTICCSNITIAVVCDGLNKNKDMQFSVIFL